MAFVSDNTEFSLGLSSWLNKAQRFIGDFFAPPAHSPEHDLLSGPLRDARLAPRVAMESSQIDVGLLSQLSSIGLKRGKQVSDASHPELMQAWKRMAARAGLDVPPQLIIAESDSLNALTVNKDEVVMTTGLLKILDLREAVAVLGHELGHVQSDHIAPRVISTVMGGGAGALLGNEVARRGGFNAITHYLGTKWSPLAKAHEFFYGAKRVGQPASTLSALGFIVTGAFIGNTFGKQFSVHPTELDADAKGAAISGDPAGLAAALTTLQQHMPPKSIKRLWRETLSGYPSVDKRIGNLQRMEAGGGYRPVVNEIAAAAAPTAAAPSAVHAPAMAVHGAASAGRLAAETTLGLS